MPSENTVTNVTQQRMAPEVVPYFTNLADTAQQVIQSPYQAYGAPRLAGLTQPEIAAQQGIAAIGMSGGPNEMGAASAAMRGAGQGISSLLPQMAGANAGGFDRLSGIAGAAGNVPMLENRDLSGYMNPYLEETLKVTEREALERARRQQANLASQMSMSGAYGGYRHGLGEADINMATNQGIMDLGYNARSDAWNHGVAGFNSDRDALFRGRDQEFGMVEGAEGFKRAGLDQMVGANQGIAGIGSNLAALGGQRQDMDLSRLGAMENAGQRTRALQQAGLDMGYQDFQKQVGYPKEQLGWFSNILNSLPVGPTETQSTMQKTPGLFQNALSTGIGGLGMYNAMQQGG